MTEQGETKAFIPQLWSDYLMETMSRPNAILEAIHKRNEEYWAGKSRWFKARYKAKRWVQGSWNDLRYRIAHAIWPYFGDDEW